MNDARDIGVELRGKIMSLSAWEQRKTGASYVVENQQRYEQLMKENQSSRECYDQHFFLAR